MSSLKLVPTPINMYWPPGRYQVIGPTLEFKCTGPADPGRYSECPDGAYAKFIARFRELKLRAVCERCLRVLARANNFSVPNDLSSVQEA